MPRKYDRDYDHESLRDEREYGFYWYSGLWRILRPVLVFLAALMIVFGAVSAIWDAVDEAFLSPIDPQDQTEIAFSVESGNSLTRVSNNLEKQGLIKNSTFFTITYAFPSAYIFSILFGKIQCTTLFG